MSFSTFFRMLALLPAFVISTAVNGQNVIHPRIYTACGGRFEFSPPYTDFASLQFTDPFTDQTVLIDSIFTESVQSLAKNESYLYLATGDSLIQYDLQTLKAQKQVYLQGINKIAVNNNFIIASRQYPVTSGFVHILDAATLELILEADSISGEAAGVLIAGDTAFVAVNGGWAGTTGKLALIALNPPSFLAEYDLGTEAAGIFDLFEHNAKIVTVNKTPWGGTSGTLSLFDPSGLTVIHSLIPHVVGNGYFIHNGSLFLNLDGNIGLFDLNNREVTNPIFIPNPAAGVFGSISSASVDTLDDMIYFNTTDYFSFGQGYRYKLEGDSTGVFPAGISPDAQIVDYPDVTAVPVPIRPECMLWPNPAGEFIHIHAQQPIEEAIIYNMNGTRVYSTHLNGKTEAVLSLGHLSPGFYCIRLKTNNTHQTLKFNKL